MRRWARLLILVGNAVTLNVTLGLMQCGVAGVLIGVGPGATCTSRGVLGLGVPPNAEEMATLEPKVSKAQDRTCCGDQLSAAACKSAI